MAKQDAQATDGKRKRRNGSVLVWVLLAMVVTGLGGYGLTNFGGPTAEIGLVGDRPIDGRDYANALQQEMQAFSAQIGQPVSREQAMALGLDRRVLDRLVALAALDNEAARVGVSVGDAAVADEIMSMDAFKGPGGTFDREAYRFTLSRNNLTEPVFETRIREDMARGILTAAIAGGFPSPVTAGRTLANWAGEERGFTLLRLGEADLPAPLPAPTEQDLTAYYTANEAAFTAPEAKRITYAALLPDMLIDTVQLDEQTLRDAYQARLAEFVQPERRLVERLVFPDDAAAQAAKARLDAGEPFEALVEERGLTLADVDMGEQSQESLGAAGAEVFALEEPGVVGPLPSDLGPALFRMNGILEAQETPFEEARETLAAEQATDAAAREITSRIETLDDLLAGGATLEELSEERGLELGTIDYVPGTDAPIAGYEAFRQAADAAKEGDFPELIQLEDGGIVALRLDEVVPPTLRPMDEVRAEVEAGARAEALTKALAARAAEIVAQVQGGTALATFGILDVTQRTTRNGFIEDAPEGLLETVFGMGAGEVRVVEAPGFAGVLRLDNVMPADPDNADVQALQDSINAQIGQQMAQDAFQLFTGALISEAGVSLDNNAISVINAQIN
jgi:peptidyl-prolyl cis-trans isomerase D